MATTKIYIFSELIQTSSGPVVGYDVKSYDASPYNKSLTLLETRDIEVPDASLESVVEATVNGLLEIKQAKRDEFDREMEAIEDRIQSLRALPHRQ